MAASAETLPAPQTYESLHVSAPDGLRLHARSYGPSHGTALPLVCLPGLARTAADFDALATAISADAETPRRVLAIDYRGRGGSEHDRNPDNYSLPVELADVLSVLTATGIGRAVFLGTSRGGLLTMMLATARPAAIAGAILNDIGPVIEPKGLIRIKSYVGKLPEPRTFAEGAEILRRLFDAQFPRLDHADWLVASHRTWEERKGRLILTYDPKLARTLRSFDPSMPVPPMWGAFDALADVPLLTIRGANSDVLSEDTVSAMQARRKTMATMVVPDQGHAPLLAEPDTIGRIADFVAECELRDRG